MKKFTLSAILTLICISAMSLNLYIESSDASLNSYITQQNKCFNYTLNREDAEVVVKISETYSGSVGNDYLIVFEGDSLHTAFKDTVNIRLSGDEASGKKYEIINNAVIAGLLNLSEDKSLLEKYSLMPKNNTEDMSIGRDRWNNWVYTFYGMVRSYGEEGYIEYAAYSTIAAKHITEKNKFKAVFSGDYYFYRYTFAPDDIYIGKKKSLSISASYIKTLSDKLSWRVRDVLLTSTYYNYKYQNELSTGVEFNLYPYKESHIQQFRISYSPILCYNRYYETTIYEKDKEWLVKNEFNFVYDVIRDRWSANVSLTLQDFLPEYKYFSVTTGFEGQFNIVKGLSLEVDGYVSLPFNQIYLPKSEYTAEQILLRQEQMGTDYIYNIYFGLNYKFGSKFASVTNIRFD